MIYCMSVMFINDTYSVICTVYVVCINIDTHTHTHTHTHKHIHGLTHGSTCNIFMYRQNHASTQARGMGQVLECVPTQSGHN